jgi:CBS domain-containing protein
LAWLAGLLAWPETVVGVFSWLALLNIVLVIFNMLPAFPLDGGRVLRSILWKVRGSLRKATYTSSRIGSGFGVFLAVFGGFTILTGSVIHGLWMILIGLFIRGAARQSYQQVLIRQMLQGEPVQRFMTPDPVTVGPDVALDDFVENYIYKHHHKMYPVVDAKGGLQGCITTRQVKQTPRDHWSQMSVGEICVDCGRENSIDPQADAVEALKRMRGNQSSRLIVVQDGRAVGIIALKDLMEMLSMKIELEGEDSELQAPPEAQELKQRAQAMRG